MNENGNGVRGEGRTWMVDVLKVEVSRPGNIIRGGGEREGAVEDDTQTLNLRGGEMKELSMGIDKLWSLFNVDLVAIRKSSDLLPFNLK